MIGKSTPGKGDLHWGSGASSRRESDSSDRVPITRSSSDAMSFYDSEHHVDFWPKTGGIKNLIIEVQEPVAVYLLKES